MDINSQLSIIFFMSLYIIAVRVLPFNDAGTIRKIEKISKKNDLKVVSISFRKDLKLPLFRLKLDLAIHRNYEVELIDSKGNKIKSVMVFRYFVYPFLPHITCIGIIGDYNKESIALKNLSQDRRVVYL